MSNEMRSNGLERSEAVARLGELFDAYGAAMARWPDHGRQLFARHADDRDVALLAAEARALDDLLTLGAPAQDVGRAGALADRILAAVAAEAASDGPELNVLPFVARRPSSPPRVAEAAQRAGFAALAASLLFGVLIGTSGAGTHAISFLAGVSAHADDDAELALSDFAPVLDEVL